MVKKILVAVDESEGSKHAFQLCLTIAKRDDEVIALFIRETSREAAVDYRATAAPNPEKAREAYELHMTEVIQAIMSPLERQSNEAGVKFFQRVEKGDPRDVICEVAKNDKVDLVVVGSRGRGPLKRLLLGSVSEFVVHHCTVPVLVARGGPGN